MIFKRSLFCFQVWQLCILLFLSTASSSFVVPSFVSAPTTFGGWQRYPTTFGKRDHHALYQSFDGTNNDNLAKQNMKFAAEQMKNLKPQDLEQMLQEMERMNPLQKQALTAMGMNPEIMKETLRMMKDNPEIMSSAQKLLETMTPEQMLEQSKMAQQRLATLSPEELKQANQAMSTIPREQLDQAVSILSQKATTASNIVDAQVMREDEDDDDDEEEQDRKELPTGPGTSMDPKVIDLMFEMAQFMSNDSTTSTLGGVTLAGFASLPVIQMLSGTREQDLNMKELKECWANGSLGATRVNRQGFERVWIEVQDYFEDDIISEARKEAKNRVSAKSRSSTTTTSTTTTKSTTQPSSSTTKKTPSSVISVGESLTPEQLKAVNERVKTMKDEEVTQVLSAMEQMDPQQQARMKAMGVDPEMMQRTASMMKNNPMMRKAAQAMMSNLSPQDMIKLSQQAQEEMKKLSPEELEQRMKELEQMKE